MEKQTQAMHQREKMNKIFQVLSDCHWKMCSGNDLLQKNGHCVKDKPDKWDKQ